jgi:Domain of unknown function (DUF4159)
MRSAWIGILTAAIVLVSAAPSARAGPVEQPQDRLVEKVRRAIDDGKAYLRRQEKNGVWEIKELGGKQFVGGTVSLAVLSLLTCGVTEDDRQAVKEGLEYLRSIPAGNGSQTYVVSLQTMVYCLAGHPEDKERIQENVDWLLSARIPASGGWTYGRGDKLSGYDSSNTQYALLALHEAVRSGARVDPRALEDIQKFYLTNQQLDGSWSYAPGIDPSMTMTTAGLCGLLISGMDLEEGKHPLQDDGSDPKCGEYKENPKVAKAVAWIADRFPAQPDNVQEAAKYFQTTVNKKTEFSAPFYGLYGIERTGRLTGQRFLGGHDWYRVGCQCLVNSQNNDGSWGDGRGLDGNPIVATCFALLFLGKGRTPVLMTKLAYGARDYNGWNNKHNDMRNVVEFAGRELFKKQPLAWQIFDVRNKPAASDEAIRDLTQQLLESPIVFFNGHDWAPRDKEQDLLKQYLANGGFVFAEACCGAKGAGAGFDKDFRQLMKKLYPGADLKPLDPTHPIYTASGKFVSLAKDFPLEGIEEGCKTLVIYCPVAVSGYWEANDFQSEKGRKAFELAANVIAYATGLEPPRQKLDAPEIVEEKKAPIRRGFFKAAQLRHDGDWQPAPKAIHNLMAEARNTGLDVVLDPKEIHPSAEAVVDYRFLYMHGRNAFAYKPSELEHLRFDLEENGGLLFADACCGSRPFDEAFRKFMEELWADRKDKPKLEPILPDDELYGAELNGKAIDYVMCRRETPDGKGADQEFKKVKPSLEGVKLNGRWVVIYSRYDIGCALEHHPTPGCLGHDYSSAVALGKAAVLYALKR